VGPNVRAVFTRYPVDFANSLFAPPYAIMGFWIGYQRPTGLSVFIEARNLADDRYISTATPLVNARGFDQPVFYPGEGRPVYAGVPWVWRGLEDPFSFRASIPKRGLWQRGDPLGAYRNFKEDRSVLPLGAREGAQREKLFLQGAGTPLSAPSGTANFLRTDAPRPGCPEESKGFLRFAPPPPW
jgi:hypothetical protein